MGTWQVFVVSNGSMDRECICASIGIMVEVVDLSYGLCGVIYFG